MGRRWAIGLGCVLTMALAPSAGAAQADREQEKLAKFTLKRLGKTPATIQAGRRFRVRGRVANAKGRRAQTGRLTFSLRNARRSSAKREMRLRGKSVKRLKGGRSRAFSLRLRIPARARPRTYYFFACVRRGSGTLRGSCKSRRMRVTPRGPGTLTPLPFPVPDPSPTPTATATPPQPADDGARRSLRAALTSENYYFVMADRFANGNPGNDRGGIAGTADQHGFDPTHKGYYHGGDLKGMLDQIDYIEDLGTTAIWLTPSFKNKPVQGPAGQRSAGYHGYWITDFTQIDPHLGSNQDLANLVEAAHARGMKVFFDIITNHTADVIGYERKGSGPTPYGYVPKDTVPYRTAAGTPFDDRDFAGGDTFPALDAEQSFPFRPVVPAAEAASKVPAWLNDVTLYHNRGDTTFVGEDSQYGDFFGLDDLFTEHPRVVDGMTEIYKQWITDYRIDGFRIDTMKHVDDEFWRAFAPDVLSHARSVGKSEFLMFGEVFDTTKRYTSHFTTQDDVQAVLDFPFQAAAQQFAANSSATENLRDFFVADDWYTDGDSNAYQLPTFLGNHDMGRIGYFIRQANSGATDDEVFRRDRLAHELMYFSRGNPVVYYGDEQGFVGDGGDQDARQDMFESQVGTYNNDDNIATDESPAEDNFDTDHPLYEQIGELAALTKAHPALRNGAQQHRLSSSSSGIYAFSRLDGAREHEYIVALNNSEQTQTARVPTGAGRTARFDRVYGDGGPPSAVTDPGSRLPVVVPPLSSVVYRSVAPIPRSAAAPELFIAPLPDGGEARDRAEVAAFVDGSSYYDVTFQARVGSGDWTPIGTDDNAPYRVFHDVSELEPGTEVQYRAVVLDNAGHSRTSDVGSATVAPPSIAMTSPPDGGARQRVALAAEATPDHEDYSVTFERSVDGGAWGAVNTDASQPAYSYSDDISGFSPGTELRYRATLTYAPGKTVTSAEREVTVTAPVTTVRIHYRRTDTNYADWGLHLFGPNNDAVLPPADRGQAWTNPREFDGTDAWGVYHDVAIADDSQQLGFIVHRQPPNENTKDPDNSPDRFITPASRPEIWLKQGDATVYDSQPPP